MERHLVDYDDLTIYHLLMNILSVMSKHTTIPQDVQHKLAETINFIIEFCPQLQFRNTSVLVNLLESYAQTNNDDPIIMKSIFNISLLLSKHKIKTKWFSDDLLIQKLKESNIMDPVVIDLLKEKYDNESAMDLDGEFDSCAENKLHDIIKELTSLNEQNERSQQLLSQVSIFTFLMTAKT